MNRVILFESEREKNDLFIIKKTNILDHLKNHLKVKVGDVIKVSIINDGIGNAQVLDIANSSISLKVFDIIPAKKPELTLLVGLCRPPSMKKILEHGATFGLKRIIFFQAELSEKSYSTSKVLEHDSVEQLFTLGVSQSAIYDSFPDFKICSSLSEALEETSSTTQIYFHPYHTEETLTDLIKGPNFFSFIFGPERGFSKSELEVLKEKNIQSALLSQSILRVEMAVFSSLGQFELLRLNNKIKVI